MNTQEYTFRQSLSYRPGSLKFDKAALERIAEMRQKMVMEHYAAVIKRVAMEIWEGRKAES